MESIKPTHELRVSDRNLQPMVIEENSLLMKTLSCVPIIGIISSLIQETSLYGKILSTTKIPRIVELINVKNQYKIVNAVRSLLTAALLVASIAFGILSSPLALGTSPLLSGSISTILLLGSAGLHIYKIHQNNAVINELQSKELRIETLMQLN